MNEYSPLEISDLSLKIGKEFILKDVNLEVKKHEFITLMGENGAGKTMLIDSVMGFMAPSSGVIKFWNKEFKKDDRLTINQKVGWVISHRETYPLGLTIRGLFDSIKHFYKNWDDELVLKLADDFKLNLNKELFYLSLGERSKVKLLKALAFHPELVILDELTSNLSPNSKGVILETIIDLFSKSEMSVFYISHFEDEASKLSDKIITLNTYGMIERGN